MKHNYNKSLFLFIDGMLAATSLLLAAFLRFDGRIAADYLAGLPLHSVIAAGSVMVLGLLCGAYNSIWTYMGFNEVFRQLAVALLSGFVFLAIKAIGPSYVSGSITLIYVGIFFVLSSMVRGIPRTVRWLQTKREIVDGGSQPTVIIGAGNAGAMIVRRLQDTPQEGFHPVALVDDDLQKVGRSISSVPIVGTVSEIAEICDHYHARQIVIAIPTANKDQINYIYDCCKQTELPVKLFRSVVDIENYFHGDSRALQDVSIEDLLFRDSVQQDMTAVFQQIKGKRVMVTGGAGSIGSEICRQVLEHDCAHLVIFDIHENGLFFLNEELKQKYAPTQYSLCMGSVRDRDRLTSVIDEYRPEILFHAAAHKHVPMMECNPMEAIKNNIFGTKNVLDACSAGGVKRFTLISTDKAVHPTNIMGATKRVAELLVQRYNGAGGCEMVAVRFGNVLGSNGSVIPTFKRQIAEGGPVTVTGREMKRYFMTIPEAVSLVLTAGTLATGGEIFVLDMGRPIKIYDLACNLIKLSGLQPEKDIEIKIIGLRPGEKLFEEIALDEESVDRTSHQKIFVLRRTTEESAFSWEAYEQEMEQIIAAHDAKHAIQLTFAAIGEARTEPLADTVAGCAV